MAPVEIAPPAFDVETHMVYATAERNRSILLGLMAAAGAAMMTPPL